MPNTNTTTLPIEFVREIATALSGTSVADFDDADFAALPAQCQVRATFAMSHDPEDVEDAVNSAWSHPESAQHIDAIAVLRGNGVATARYSAISAALGRKVNGSFFVTVNTCSKLPPGTVSIILLAISHSQSTKPAVLRPSQS